jgi:hypothetical protein
MSTNGVTWQANETASDTDVDQLLHPSRFYARPADVAGDHLLTIDERRAILASWASDTCAVESNPALRQPPEASVPVTFDEIMNALVQLDRMKRTSNTVRAPWWPRHRPSIRPGA